MLVPMNVLLAPSPLKTRLALAVVALSLCCSGAVAQTNKAAATDAAAERAQRQSDNVYRWIKMHAEPVRKTEPNKAEAARTRPKSDGATAPAPASAQAVGAAPAPVAPAANGGAATPAVLAAEDARATAATPAASALAVAAPSVAEPVSAPREALAAATARPVEPPEPEPEDELKVLAQPQPEIPRELRNQLSSGKVTLAFTVQTGGNVTDVSVLSSSHRRLNRPAQDAVAQWKFAPVKTARAVKVDLEFDLQ